MPEGFEDVFCCRVALRISRASGWSFELLLNFLFQQVYMKCLLWSRSFLVMEDRGICGLWGTDD